MQPYDLVMLAVLAGATFFGLIKGMAWQAASLASITLSYFVALNFSEPLAPMFHSQAPWNRFIAMAVLYVLTSCAVWLAFRVVAGAIDKVRLKSFDRQIGAMIGLAKGIALCLAITFFAVTLSASTRGAVLKSRSGGYIAQVLNKADSVMPPELHEVLDPYIEKLERGLDPSQADPDPIATSGELGRELSRDLPSGLGGGFRDAVERTVKDSLGREFGVQPSGSSDDDEWESEQPAKSGGWGSTIRRTWDTGTSGQDASNRETTYRQSKPAEEYEVPAPRPKVPTADDSWKRSGRYQW